MRKSRVGALAAFSAVVVLLVAACGSDNSKSSPTSTTATSGGTATTAVPVKADPSKPPVLVGFHSLEGGAISLPDIGAGFMSGVNYVNEDLGGINGRPMKVDACHTDVTPESSVNCANKFVEDKVVAAVQGIDAAADAALPILKQAGLVDLGFIGVSPGMTKARGDAFFTLFDTRELLVQSLIMQQKLGAHNVAIMQQDVAANRAYYDEIIKPAADSLGLDVTPFYYSFDADWATLAATVMSTNPDGINFTGATDPVCLAAIPAIRSAGFTGPLWMSSCTRYLDELPPDQVDGIINSNQFYFSNFESSPPKAASDLAIYQRYITRDAPNLQSGTYGQLGFHIAVQAADMLRQVKGDITPQTVRATMPHTSGPMFFRDTNYDCSKNYWPPDSSACSSEVIWTRATKNRTKVVLDINPIDTSALRPKG